MAPQTYGGPTALAYSRYASPPMRKVQPMPFPLAVSSTNITPASNTIATREQTSASHDEPIIDTTTQNPDAQLAVAQGNILKEEVDKHAVKFSTTLSSAVTNTRRLLELIRKVVQKEDALALKSVDDLWTELEQLFEAAKGTKNSLPNFLEKQRNNMALYHASVMNETYRESQAELNMQHKKINLQHGLILEHQQAFQDYKAQTAFKLKELEDLQERVSRLTLEKGNFRGEVEKYAQLLEKEQTTRAEDLRRADALNRELESLAASKKQLLTDIEDLQKTTTDLQARIQATEQQVTDRFTAELKEKADLLAKETEKTASLTTLINTLKGNEKNFKMEIDKAKAETKLTSEKYNHMAAEHSHAFSKAQEQSKYIETLTTDAERLRTESTNMKERFVQLSELEKDNADLLKEKADLVNRVSKMAIKINEANENCVKVNKELAALTDKITKVQKDNGILKAENNRLLLQQVSLKSENDKATQASQSNFKLKDENSTPNAMVDELKANQTVHLVDGSATTEEDRVVLKENIKVLQEQNVKLQGALGEWTSLAKRSYKEYKDMLPTYKQAEQLRKSALEKDDQIKGLIIELSTAKASQTNGMGSGGDATYWKDKYDGLLSSIGG